MALIIVLGANGAIGRALVARFKSNAHRVGGIGHGPAEFPGMHRPDVWIPGDVSRGALDEIRYLMGTPNYIFNLTGASTVGTVGNLPFEDFQRSIHSTAVVLNWMKECSPLARYICASSAAVYGNFGFEALSEEVRPSPVSLYGFHKLALETLVTGWAREFNLSAAIVRLFSVYGPEVHKQLIYELTVALNSAVPTVNLHGTGDEVRDWIFIEDAADAMIACGESASSNAPIFNGCTGQGHTIKELANIMVRAFHSSTHIEFNQLIRAGDPPHLVGCTKRLRTTGFMPKFSLQHGISRYVTTRTNK